MGAVHAGGGIMIFLNNVILKWKKFITLILTDFLFVLILKTKPEDVPAVFGTYIYM